VLFRITVCKSSFALRLHPWQRIVIIATPTRPPRRDRHGPWQPNGTCITCTFFFGQVCRNMAALRQPSTHVPACGAPTRDAAAARLFEILNAAPEYHAAVQQLRELDELKDDDWRPIAAAAAGFGTAQFQQQDGKGALLANQLIPADTAEVEAHVRRALELQHPAASRGDGYTAEQRYERRREAELESAVRRCVQLGEDTVRTRARHLLRCCAGGS